MTERDLEDRAAEQNGLLTARQCATALGSHWRRSAYARSLEALYPSVMRLRGSPHSWLQDLHAACLAIAGAVASHRSAARLHGLRFVPRVGLEVTIGRRGGCRVRGVILHRSNKLLPEHVTVVDGVPTTTILRTLFDLSSVVSVAQLGKIVDDARRRGLVTYAEYQVIREQMRARGRRRTTYVDRVLMYRVGTKDESDKEKQVLRWLRSAGLEPEQQHWVTINGKRRRLDFAFVAEKVGLEYQGYNDHTVFETFTDDFDRTTEFQLAGWLMIFYTAKTTKATALRQVNDALALRRRQLGESA